MKVSIIIPVYNEAQTLDQVLERVRAAKLPPGCIKEIVVVDDGSTDGTADKLRHYASSGVVVGHNSVLNFGKGAAVRISLTLATGDILLIQDGDLEYDPADYAKILDPIVRGKADIVYGSRFLSNPKGMAFKNRLANRILTWTTNLLYGAGITDEATGYKAFRASTLRGVQLECLGFEFCPEVTAKLLRLGHTIHEVPISYNGRKITEGKKIRTRHGFEALWTLIQYRFTPRSRFAATPHTPMTRTAPSAIPPARRNSLLTAAALLFALLFAAYANHFHNTFHFDDAYSVVTNPYIRSLANIRSFFTDARTYSTYVTNQNYRPLLTLSLALDYWAGHGLDPFWFQLSTFCWYLVLLGSIFALFRLTLNKALPDPRNGWVALFATAIFGLHPAMAETVNYVLQRGDVYSTLGVVLGLALYAGLPRLRRYGLYLLPPVIAIFAKEPTAVFPALLFLWIWLFDGKEDGLLAGIGEALLRILPASAIMGALAVFVIRMQPPTYNPGAHSPFLYRISQPAVLLTYFRKFFLPTGFSADTDRTAYSSPWDPHAIAGYLFLALVLAAIVLCRRSRRARPISFGLAWFLVASLPTSWVGLGEIENDHRMFFPFVGLTLAVCWTIALWLYRSRVPRAAIVSALTIILLALAWGTHQRNIIWHTDESLWYDVTLKSPRNGRGLMNYGLTQMGQGRYDRALDYFQRASVYTPNYFTLEINLGIVYSAMGRNAEAEQHFLRAISLAPSEGQPRFFYGRWLYQQGRTDEAIRNVRLAMQLNPDLIDANHLLMRIYANQRNQAQLMQITRQTLQQFPGDSEAQSVLANSGRLGSLSDLIEQSLQFYRAGKFQESIDAARQALALQPNLPEAYNNIAAGYASLGQWDQAIAAAEQAIRLRPDYQLAKNNLAWAQTQKAKAAQH